MNPDGSQPSSVLKVAKHTVFVETTIRFNNGTTKTKSGTGFLVSEDLVLTAAHVVVHGSGTVMRIAITYEGLKIVDSDAARYDCELVEVMPRIYAENFDRHPMEDLAILRCLGHHSFLRLSTVTPSEGTDVQVIGYPGKIEKTWLKKRHGSEIIDLESAIKDARALLPRNKLNVTKGQITSIDHSSGCATHEASTVPGMSGGCLLYGDNVCGTLNLSKIHLLICLGVHLGHSPNTAVLFSCDPVRAFLEKHRVLLPTANMP